MVWYKFDFAKLTETEIKTLKAKMLQLPSMSMDMFDNVTDNIDKHYPFSLSPKLILALLVTVGICVTALGIIFIWYKRKTTLSTSTMGNLVKHVPSLVGNTSSLDSLLPILSELASSRTRIKTTPITATPHQTTSDELILPPVLLPRLQVIPSFPSASTAPQPVHLVRGPIYKNQGSKHTSKDETIEPVSLVMFNKAATDLESKGVIDLKKYIRYLTKKTSRPV